MGRTIQPESLKSNHSRNLPPNLEDPDSGGSGRDSHESGGDRGVELGNRGGLLTKNKI